MSIETTKLQFPSVLVLPDGRMDAKNTAAYTGLTVKTLAIMRSNGTGPRFVKIGRVFYYREDLDAWLKSRVARSTAQARTLANARGAI
jgi:predicted DNA-binding transcriptional regulator AlpA